MTDTWNVTASYDKSSYNQGDTMTVALSGSDVLTSTTTTQQQSGNLTLSLTAADGSVTTVEVPAVTINVTSNTSTTQTVKITGVSDSSGRVWTIAANGLSATATA